MTAPVLPIASDTVEWAIFCADGRAHFGDRYAVRSAAERLRVTLDLIASRIDCGGAPHVIKTRHRIVTEWTEETP